MYHAQSVPEPPRVSSLPPDISISSSECPTKHSDVGHSDFSSSSQPFPPISHQAKDEWNKHACLFFLRQPSNLTIPFLCKKIWTTGKIEELCQAVAALKEILVGQLWLDTFPFSEAEKNQLAYQCQASGEVYVRFISLLNDLLQSLSSYDFHLLVEQHIILSYLERLIAVTHQLEAAEVKLAELLAAFREKPALQAASHLISIFKLISSQIVCDARELSLYLSARQDAQLHQWLHAKEAL